MQLVISKDVSNHSVVFINKSILSKSTSSHFLGFMCALLYTHSLCVYRILNQMLISHDGLWRVSVTTSLVRCRWGDVQCRALSTQTTQDSPGAEPRRSKRKLRQIFGIKLNRQLIHLPNTQTGRRHPNFRTKHDKTRS